MGGRVFVCRADGDDNDVYFELIGTERPKVNGQNRYQKLFIRRIDYFERRRVMTEKEVLEMVRRDGWTLWRVPLELRTEAMCVEAVKNDDALCYVPEALRECVRAAIETGKERLR